MTTSTVAFSTEAHLADLADAHGEEVTFPPQHVIFAQGNQGNQLYIIRAGTVKTMMDGPSDKEILLNLHGPADIVGELSACDPGPRTSTAIA
ncbi:cyclic nucleotide-binding domain-containing protein [Nocardia sp. NRRL S-836]|uniref:cyclic nucleotide-binding domain-containing protein n=1 Tax=Nocardia sp. NRRL S-836 TaxID=1519492 RepID=UPI0006B0121B|nr:cyclic nucleotide-binding domain-containing protein [Nocardia sp. NRRL S-836]KOV84683.1 hypothetical protein ADL03_15510 [Nocardia sp. NRRL S-836]